MTKRHYSITDQLCLGFDQALRAVANIAKTTGRVNPSHAVQESTMSNTERQYAASLMRINHAGEVSAQALYHGQGVATRSPVLKQQMQNAAVEEGDHLAWCQERLCELGSHTSYLNPFWYAGSFAIGFTAGLIGDKWSLGFLAETERQVVDHLEKHMTLLANQDAKSYQILHQMQQDEAMHRDQAIKAGAASLPKIVQRLMQWMSKVMVKTAYKI